MREQLEDYAAVAGNKNKIVEMKPSDCDCGQENQRSKVPSRASRVEPSPSQVE